MEVVLGLARRSQRWLARNGGEVGGLAQLARAPALQAGGHRFESDILHQRGKEFENRVIPVARFAPGSNPIFSTRGEEEREYVSSKQLAVRRKA